VHIDVGQDAVAHEHDDSSHNCSIRVEHVGLDRQWVASRGSGRLEVSIEDEADRTAATIATRLDLGTWPLISQRLHSIERATENRFDELSLIRSRRSGGHEAIVPHADVGSSAERQIWALLPAWWRERRAELGIQMRVVLVVELPGDLTADPCGERPPIGRGAVDVAQEANS
jgi:hypothetical protein